MHMRDVRACDARECTTRAVALGLQASDKQKCNVALLGPGVPGIQPPAKLLHTKKSCSLRTPEDALDEDTEALELEGRELDFGLPEEVGEGDRDAPREPRLLLVGLPLRN